MVTRLGELPSCALRAVALILFVAGPPLRFL